MTEIVAIIPARSGSKGIKDKNIMQLGGHPLISWSIIACKKANLIDRIIVSTDSEKYSELCIKYGAEVPFIRPEYISRDNSTDYEFIEHALDWFNQNESEPKIIIHIRPTTPIRDPVVINEAIINFKNNAKATSLRSVHEMSESAYKTFEFNNKGYLKPILNIEDTIDYSNKPRQLFPKTYQANGYVDVLSVSYIRNKKQIHGDCVIPYVTTFTQEIDTENDMQFLEYQLYKTPKIEKDLFR